MTKKLALVLALAGCAPSGAQAVKPTVIGQWCAPLPNHKSVCVTHANAKIKAVIRYCAVRYDNDKHLIACITSGMKAKKS
jgi:hypothetical protein